MAIKSKLSGARVPSTEATLDRQSVRMPIPSLVTIPITQHLGAPNDVLVKVGDTVKVGQKIGDSNSFICAPVHSSVSGTVESIGEITWSGGKKINAVTIKPDGEQLVSESVAPPVINSKEDFVKAIRESGLVGLGGAGFPTHVKYTLKNQQKVETLIINAAECEPFITSDNQTITEDTQYLIDGIKAVTNHLDAQQCIVVVEEHRKSAIDLLKSIADKNNFKVAVLSTLYPKGAEKVIIYEVLSKTLPEGKLPIDIGIVVSNVTTVAFVGRYLKDGMPLIERRITIDGGAIKEPKNVIAPVGASLADIIEFAGGYRENPSKIIIGGPMMGIALPNADLPLLKQSNAVIAFGSKDITSFTETPCIRCARCMRSCPVNLTPFLMKFHTERNHTEQLKKLKVNLCIECGVCSYVCPARQELVQSHRTGKQLIAQAEKEGNGK